MRRRQVAFVLLIVVLLGAIAYWARKPDSSQPLDPIGVWTAGDGLAVTLRRDGTYHFCDGRDCADGFYLRPRNNDGSDITLLDFFAKPNAARIEAILKNLGARQPWPFEKTPGDDLDFSLTSGVYTGLLPGNCNGEPCVLFGNLDLPRFLAFTKGAARGDAGRRPATIGSAEMSPAGVLTLRYGQTEQVLRPGDDDYALFIATLGNVAPGTRKAIPQIAGVASIVDGLLLKVRWNAGDPRGPIAFAPSVHTFPPNHNRYDDIVAHAGGLERGQTKGIAPWPGAP